MSDVLPSAPEQKQKEQQPQSPEPVDGRQSIETSESKSGNKMLVLAIIFTVLLFGGVLAFVAFHKPTPKTIDDLHAANLNHKLPPAQGYLYKEVYSFVQVDGFWYTQLSSVSGKTLYNLALRYSPRELEEITISGWLNDTLFNEAEEYYVTFNPAGSQFSHVALAVGDFNSHMTKAFDKKPIAGCDRNETHACLERPVITCDTNTSALVFYVKEAEQSRVYYQNNCIVVEGSGFDLVKNTDRILYNFYKIMEK